MGLVALAVSDDRHDFWDSLPHSLEEKSVCSLMPSVLPVLFVSG